VKTASRKQQVVDIWNGFKRPASIGEVTAECIKQGVWTKEERDGFVFRGANGFVRDVLNKEGIDQCPLSLTRIQYEEDADGNVTEVTLYVQREFWSEGDAKEWVKRRVKQLSKDFRKVEHFIENYCKDRWPEIDWWSLVPFRLPDDSAGEET